MLCVRFLPDSLHAEGLPGNAEIDHAALHPNVFVGIDTDGTVHIIAHRSEMGTTSRTSVPSDSGRRTGCRLEARETRAGHRRRALRLAKYRRLPLHPRILRAHAPGRRNRAHDAHASRRQPMGRSGVGVQSRPAHRRPLVRRDAASVTANSRPPPRSCPCPK